MGLTSPYPLVEEISIPLTATKVFERFQDKPFSFFLDSGMDPVRLGRYSFIGIDPFLIMKSKRDRITLFSEGKEETCQGNPFDVLGELLMKFTLAPQNDLAIPLVGGAVGYFAYDLCHFIERLPSIAIDDLKLPESYFAFYDTILAFDHLEGRTYIASSGFPELEESQRVRRAKERLKEMASWLASPFLLDKEVELQAGDEEVLLHSNFSPEGYVRAVARVREYIAAGDVFQVNLSQRFEAPLIVSPYELYRRLRQVNPAPFAAYLNFGELALVSASPERFLRLQGDWVETRPIKGTRPRGKNPIEDKAQAQELLHSIKDRAENVMIVDLERNDLGKVCCYGTVKVTELAVLETFPTVFHLTSTIIGRLRPDKNSIDLIKATFPGGSITGAPKVRAMEIIEELEPTKRSVYTGSLGYLSFNGNLDLNIVIRTFLVKSGKAYFQVGGGIVYDSNPEAEYVETLDKAKALIQALKLARKVAVGVR